MNKYTKAALVADALCLGPHWIYNSRKLARLFPSGVYEFTDPLSSYHPNRKAGQFTHYGDQLILLEEYVSSENTFEVEAWRTSWLTRMSQYDGYIDGATAQALESKGKGSGSNDLAGASRIAPLFALDVDLIELICMAREQTAVTHGALCVQDAAEFFARAVNAIENGSCFLEAMQLAAVQGEYIELDVDHFLRVVNSALDSKKTAVEVSEEMGTTCHTPEAFPLTLYLALKFSQNTKECLSENAMVGGDSAARGMLLAILFAARDGDVEQERFTQLIFSSNHTSLTQPSIYEAGTHMVTVGTGDKRLSAILEIPQGEIKAFILFAHCFTCGKDFMPEKRLCTALASWGFASMRVDFSGVGASSGQFEKTSFLTNLEDLIVASNWMKHHEMPISVLVGHSMGGTASLAVASEIEGIKAIVTIGSPFEPKHIFHLFEQAIPEIKSKGRADVLLAGRPFTIGKKFIDDLAELDQLGRLRSLEGIHSLVMHVPDDDTVEIKNAGYIYSALPHPKSFIALPGADHLLMDKAVTEYIAKQSATWLEYSLTLGRKNE